MLSKLIVDNFKAIEHLELDLRPFQVFVGPNDSGKSTVLQALDLLSRSAAPAIGGRPSLFEDHFERYLPLGDASRTLKLEVRGTCIGGADYRYRIGWSAGSSPRLSLEELIVGSAREFLRRDHETSELSRGR